MEYDYTGTRIKKHAPAGITLFPFQGVEIDPNGVTTKYIRIGVEIFAAKRGTQQFFYLNDHLGGVNIITDASWCQRNEYDPWGSVSRQEGNCDPTHRFTGKELDPETGLYYYGGRYYDHEISRFASPDPFVTSPDDPQSLDRYSYTFNNPQSYIDPSGYEGEGSSGQYSYGIYGWVRFFIDLFSKPAEHKKPVPRAYNHPMNQPRPVNSGLPTSENVIKYLHDCTGSDYPGGGCSRPLYIEPYRRLAYASGSDYPDEEPWGKDLWISLRELLDKPVVFSFIIPIIGPVPGRYGLGPAGGLAWNPETHKMCVAPFGLGVAAGRTGAIGPLTARSGDIDKILEGLSISAGGNLPFPSQGRGIGWTWIANASGVAQGPTAGDPGWSGAVTVGFCYKLY